MKRQGKEYITVFLSAKTTETIIQCDEIISLNVGDGFYDREGNLFKVVKKRLNVNDRIMIYYGEETKKETDANDNLSVYMAAVELILKLKS